MPELCLISLVSFVPSFSIVAVASSLLIKSVIVI